MQWSIVRVMYWSDCSVSKHVARPYTRLPYISLHYNTSHKAPRNNPSQHDSQIYYTILPSIFHITLCFIILRCKAEGHTSLEKTRNCTTSRCVYLYAQPHGYKIKCNTLHPTTLLCTTLECCTALSHTNLGPIARRCIMLLDDVFQIN